MTYLEFYRRVCDLTSGLGLIVRTESFMIPDLPAEQAVFVSSNAHEAPVSFFDISPLPTVADATVQARVDGALDMLEKFVSGEIHLDHRQAAAYRRLSRQSEKMKPKLRLLHA